MHLSDVMGRRPSGISRRSAGAPSQHDLLGAAAYAALLFAAVPGSAAFARAEQATLVSTVAYGAADPLYQQPYIDIDEWRDLPTRHRYVHGGFRGTDLKFSFYFPDKPDYHGRFFQYVAPIPTPEDTALRGSGENDRIAFAFESGGYLVESNMGGTVFTKDASITAFRGSAAAADYSRIVATKLYGGKRPYGYIYGGSGGGYRTMAAIENTNVWDGAVPYVIGSPRAMQVMVHGHSRATRVLRSKIPQIVDALDAGGSGDMYAGLSTDEAAALREVTRFGFPPRTWALVEQASEPLAGLPGTGIDPTYFTDFWSKQGYEGSDPASYAARHRLQFQAKVSKLLTAADSGKRGIQIDKAEVGYINPVGQDFARAGEHAGASVPAPTNTTVAIELASVPENADLTGAVLLVKSGPAAGRSIPLSRIVGNVAVAKGGKSADVAMLRAGDEIQIDNSDSLAREVVLRYQVPSRDYVVWNQYRGAAGQPLTPQTTLQPESEIGGPGTLQTGRFKGKVIVVASLMDETAHPWNADWYRTKVQQNLGSKLDSRFRLWFTDNAMHGDAVEVQDPTRVVSYLGILYQALRDVSAWVEKGVEPPASTNYRLVDGQIVVPPEAADRLGVQPVVRVTVNGAARASVKPGEPVALVGVIDLPPRTGKVVRAEWDFEGAGTFSTSGELRHLSATTATVNAVHSFSKPGTYFAVLRATSHREGDEKKVFGRIRNIGRVRIVVK